ncbi:hypothetical protein MASSI9I_50922 [Massilia sp. 9I]|nr:hypothetical protein MASSI9I_50922 [Massilia sp. 9I]
MGRVEVTPAPPLLSVVAHLASHDHAPLLSVGRKIPLSFIFKQKVAGKSVYAARIGRTIDIYAGKGGALQ